MNHTRFETLLPLYAAGRLAGAEREAVEAHLPGCSVCQAELELWQAVAGEIGAANRPLAAPPAVLERALEQIQAPRRPAAALRHAWNLLYAQALVVQREMWPTTAAIMALGVIVALLSRHLEFVYFITPLVAAASLSTLCSAENDPAYELTRATPTSGWKVLLARLSLVSAYNLLLALAALLVLMFFAPPGLLGTLAVGLLAPLAFLSALALLLAQWLGAGNAIGLTYVLWIAQFVPYRFIGRWMEAPAWEGVLDAYRQFWQSPLLLLALTVLLLAAALWSANRPLLSYRGIEG